MTPSAKPIDVLILGGTGMLGSMLVDVFARSGRFAVGATARTGADTAGLVAQHPQVAWRALDAAQASEAQLVQLLRGHDYAINAVGLIRQKMDSHSSRSTRCAIEINARFPHLLAAAAAQTQTTVLQIATDCVYSGRDGSYGESAAHDPSDAYGMSKSLGEVESPFVRHLRCSIIGPERHPGPSLLSWFLSRRQNETVSGYTNHLWNGVTSLHFARLCLAVAERRASLPPILHVTPADVVSKCDLLKLFAQAFGRMDVTIEARAAASAVDRILRSEDKDANAALWAAAGYSAPPTIASMVGELAGWSGATLPLKQAIGQ